MQEYTYFFQKTNGEIFSITGEETAWKQFAHPTKVFTNDLPPRLIGRSDGNHFREKTLGIKELYSQNPEQAKKLLKEAQEEELEIAKKTPIPPRNFDNIDKQTKQPFTR